MRASQLLLLALVLLSSNRLARASIESSITPEADCSPAAIMIGDKCTAKVCQDKCLALGATRGKCIEGPACNCDFCGPNAPPPSLLQ
uniref:Knottin scorpion toxin-like domain-containing protein n=1 Tax=Oryza brachyantha TaxID=4533 RepID=J3LC28_ORYBR